MSYQKDYDEWTLTHWWMRTKVFEVQSELACTLFDGIHKLSKNSWSKMIKYLWPSDLQRLFQMWRSNTLSCTPQNSPWHCTPRTPEDVWYALTFPSHVIHTFQFGQREIFLKPDVIISQSQNITCKKSVFNQYERICLHRKRDRF